jgi:type II secretory ATPase GspE/PulE/Tfp pilus assembly ATPase PilB-like protein
VGLEKLGFNPEPLVKFRAAITKPYGMILVTGPTGSGKSTTLYAVLNALNTPARNIMTVEDPVEYQVEGITQTQILPDIGLTFASGLRSILRQSPDIILVGEIRDTETGDIAVKAALTGHLVLSTLHTNDSSGAVTRLQDMGVEPYKIAAAVVGVIAQRLLRTICPKCRTSYYPPAEILEALHFKGDNRRSFAKGEGCRDCYDTGFHGRIGIYEVLVIEQVLREFIADGANLETIRKWFRENGGNTLLDEGLRVAEKEVTSLDEVMRVAFFE